MSTAKTNPMWGILSEAQQAYRKDLLAGEKTAEPAERKPVGRRPAPTLSQSFKTFKDSPEYGRLYEATENREYVIEHLIYRAFAAGFKAK